MTATDLSFELFPFRNPAKEGAFLAGVARLQAWAPLFISLTYGAGGSGRQDSERQVALLQQQGVPDLAGHLTAAGNSRERIAQLAADWQRGGMRRIVALRGDAGAEQDDGYACAAELTAALKAIAPFEISVAGYPEGHPKSASAEAEMAHLKRKVENGASRVITQFFFDADIFLRFRDSCRRHGVAAPVVPGILPVADIGQVRRFSAACGATVPDWLEARHEGLDSPAAVFETAVETAARLMESLQREGVSHIHLYTLNRFSMTEAICRALGRTPAPAHTDNTERKVA